MSIVYWCLHIWGDSIQAACSGNGQANFDKEFETMIDNGRETLHRVCVKGRPLDFAFTEVCSKVNTAVVCDLVI